jgi:hypothetical protein
VPGKADEEIFPNQGWVWGGIPHIGKIPHCSLEEGGKKKKKKEKEKKGKGEGDVWPNPLSSLNVFPKPYMLQSPTSCLQRCPSFSSSICHSSHFVGVCVTHRRCGYFLSTKHLKK